MTSLTKKRSDALATLEDNPLAFHIGDGAVYTEFFLHLFQDGAAPPVQRGVDQAPEEAAV
jgi:hypothetical protein